MIKRLFNIRFIRFCISGGIATAVDIVFLYIFTEFVGVWYILSAVGSFFIGSFVHFLISRNWVFKKREAFFKEYVSFTSVHVVALLVSLIFLYILTEYAHIYYLISKALTVVVSVMITFLGNLKITFRGARVPKQCPVCLQVGVFLKYKGNISSTDGRYAITENAVGMSPDMYVCPSCGLGFVADSEYMDDVKASYDSSFFDEDYEREDVGRKRASGAILKKLKKFIKGENKKKILDIGCYSGIFLQTAAEMGLEAHGLEASAVAVDRAREKNMGSIVHGYLESADSLYEDSSFDVISAIDVVEHLKDPKVLFDFASSKLKKDGLIVLATPNFKSLMSKVMGRKWYAVLPHHFYYFSYNSLKKVLEEAGFSIIKRSTQPRYFSVRYLLQRLNNYTWISWLSRVGMRNRIIREILLPVNFFDQMLIIAKKK